MRPPFSLRTGWDLGESALAATARLLRQQGRLQLDLTVSNPTICGFTYDAAALLAPLAPPGALTYDPDPRGLRAAREAIAGYYAGHGAAIDPGTLLLTTSTSEGYSFLFRLLCDAGDDLLVARPSYPLFDFLADLDNVRLRPYPLFYDFGWCIDFFELERAIGPRTRALLVVHPNNPTGHWTREGERERLLDLCDRHSLALIVDEVFLDYPLSKSADAVTFAVGKYRVPVFILSGMSKIAGLPQMKVAWILTLGPKAFSREALARLEVVADTFLSMNAPVQHALPAWMAERAAIQHQIRGRLSTNLRALETSGLTSLPVEAGWSAVLRYTADPETLLREEGVLVHPGGFYGMGGANRVVISMLAPEADFTEGVHRMRRLAASTG